MSNFRRFLAVVLLTLGTVALLGLPSSAQLNSPDLSVAEVSTDPHPPTPGEQVTLRANVENVGGADSNDFTYNFTLDGEPFGEEQLSDDGLDEGENVTVNATSTWEVALGDHTIEANIAHEDSVTTQDDNAANDHRESTFTVGADLQLSELSFSPEEPMQGEEVTLSVDVENIAAAENHASDAEAPFQVRFVVDDETITEQVDGLAAGESETVTATWTGADHGEHTLEATVDPDGDVGDLDRSNNDAGPVTLAVDEALPDLVVSGLAHAPQAPRPGQNVEFEATISNNGHDDAGEHSVGLRVGDEVVDTATIESLAQGEQATANLTWQAVEGRHDIVAVADVDDAVAEVNDDNNEWTTSVAVGSDLLVEQFEVQPEQPRAGDRVRLHVQIGNEGLDVDEAFEVAFEVDGDTFDTMDVDELANGASRNITSTAWTATVGDHEVAVVLDPEDTVPEIDVENNRQAEDLTVGEPRPDLAVFSASLDPSSPEPGQPSTVRAQVHNVGARDADTFVVTARLDGESLAEVTVDELTAGNWTSIDLGEWTAEEGVHLLNVTADPDDDVEELSEKNNSLERRLGIGLDLEAISLTVDTGQAEAGDNVTALLLARNNGTVNVPETNVTFTLDGGLLTTARLGAIPVNEEASVEIDFAAPGSGTLEAQLDASEQLSEFDEANNLASAQLGLEGDAPPPDLTVRAVEVDGDEGGEEPIRFVAEVANEGEGPAPSAEVVFRLDGEALGEPAELPSLDAGQQTTVTSGQWTPDGDDHELEVVVDDAGGVDETDETNNAFTYTIDSHVTSIPLATLWPLVTLALAAIAARRAG